MKTVKVSVGELSRLRAQERMLANVRVAMIETSNQLREAKAALDQAAFEINRVDMECGRWRRGYTTLREFVDKALRIYTHHEPSRPPRVHSCVVEIDLNVIESYLDRNRVIAYVAEHLVESMKEELKL